MPPISFGPVGTPPIRDGVLWGNFAVMLIGEVDTCVLGALVRESHTTSATCGSAPRFGIRTPFLNRYAILIHPAPPPHQGHLVGHAGDLPEPLGLDARSEGRPAGMSGPSA